MLLSWVGLHYYWDGVYIYYFNMIGLLTITIMISGVFICFALGDIKIELRRSNQLKEEQNKILKNNNNK